MIAMHRSVSTVGRLHARGKWAGGDDLERGQVDPNAVQHPATDVRIPTRIDPRTHLRVAPGARRSEENGLVPGRILARQVAERLAGDYDGDRETVVLVAWIGDKRRLLEELDTLRVDPDTLENLGEPRRVEGLADNLLMEPPVLPGK